MIFQIFNFHNPVDLNALKFIILGFLIKISIKENIPPIKTRINHLIPFLLRIIVFFFVIEPILTA